MNSGFSDADRLKRSALAAVALRMGWWRGFKLARGYWRTYIRKGYLPYEPSLWWEAYHSAADGSDASTIELSADPLVSQYHYATIETLILRVLHTYGMPQRVLDLGSGAGHWLNFYQRLGCEVTGVELSSEAARRLRERFSQIEQCHIADMELSGFDLVNAIGVMFHIVDDDAHRRAISAIGQAIKPGGLLIVGGGFPLISVNVQFDEDSQVNKRLRSRRYWRQELESWMDVRFIRNRAAREIHAIVPESDLLIAIR